MQSALPSPAPWWRRLAAMFRYGPPPKAVETEQDHVAGADYASGLPVGAAYDVHKALSAMAAFPWNYAAVNAVAADWAGLPWKVSRRRRDGTQERLADHPALALMRRPSERVLSEEFFRQLIVHFRNAGEAYILEVGLPGRPPASMLLLHPARCEPVARRDGQPDGIIYDSTTRYSWEQVRHIRLPSWADGPESLHGVGGIEPLNNALTASLNAQKTAAKQAARPMPSGILQPEDAKVTLAPEQITPIRVAYNKQMSGDGNGLLIIGHGGLRYTPLGWSPRDMEYVEQEQLTRDQILAVHDVPGVRVGIPNANYATDQAQSARYWEGLQALSRLVCAHLSLIAQKFDPDLEISKDFSGVEALQYARTEQVERVKLWWDMGVPLKVAATFEGLSDLPDVAPEPRSAPTTPQKDQDQKGVEVVVGAAPDTDADAVESLLLACAAEAGGEWIHAVLRGLERPEGTDTGFPVAGESRAVRLRNSAHRLAPLAQCARLAEMADLWAAADPLARHLHARLRAIQERGGRPEGAADEVALRLREAWAARAQAPTTAEAAASWAAWLVHHPDAVRLLDAALAERVAADFWAGPRLVEEVA